MSYQSHNTNTYNLYSVPQFTSATEGKCLKTVIRDYEPRKTANIRQTMRTFDASVHNVYKYKPTIPIRFSVTPRFCLDSKKN